MGVDLVLCARRGGIAENPAVFQRAAAGLRCRAALQQDGSCGSADIAGDLATLEFGIDILTDKDRAHALQAALGSGIVGVDLTAVHCERRKALRGASGQADGTGRDAQDADVCLRGIGHGIVVNFAAVQDDAAAAFRGRKADRRRLAGVVMDARAVVHGEVGVMQIENIAAGRNGIADLGARIQRQLAGRAVADDIAGERRAVLGSPALRAAVNADILERQVTGGVHPEHVAALVALGTRDHRIRILAQIPDLRITDGDHARDINDLVGRIRQQLLGAGKGLNTLCRRHAGFAVVAVLAVEVDIVELCLGPGSIDRNVGLDALITVEELRAGLVHIPAVEDVVVLRRILRVRDILAVIDLRRIVDLAVDDIGHGIDIGLPLAVERQVRRDRRGEVIDLRVGGVRVPVRHMGADAAGLRHGDGLAPRHAHGCVDVHGVGVRADDEIDLHRTVAGREVDRNILIKVREDEYVLRADERARGGGGGVELKAVFRHAVEAELHIGLVRVDLNARDLLAVVLGIAVLAAERDGHGLARLRRLGRLGGLLRGLFRRLLGRLFGGFLRRLFRRLLRGLRRLDRRVIRDLHERAEDLGGLGARDGPLRQERAVRITGQNPGRSRHGDGLLRIVLDARGIRIGQLAALGERERLPARKADQQGHGVLTGNGLVGGKRAVRIAKHDAVFRRPAHGSGIPLTGRDIGEAGLLRERVAAQAGKDRDEHGARHGILRRKVLIVHAVHDALFRDVFDIGMRPMGVEHIGIAASRRKDARAKPKHERDRQKQG